MDPPPIGTTVFYNTYSGQPLSAGAKKRARNQQNSAPEPKQRVRSESAAGISAGSVTGKKHTGKPCAEAK
jgi:hypothetical protein